jgi:integrase
VVPDGDAYHAVGRQHRPAAPTAIQYRAAAVKHVAHEQAGGLRFHDLRHSYATCLMDDGVPPNVVQRVMGHERSSTTLDLYTRRTEDSTRIQRALDGEDPADGAAAALVPA